MFVLGTAEMEVLIGLYSPTTFFKSYEELLRKNVLYFPPPPPPPLTSSVCLVCNKIKAVVHAQSSYLVMTKCL